MSNMVMAKDVTTDMCIVEHGQVYPVFDVAQHENIVMIWTMNTPFISSNYSAYADTHMVEVIPNV